MSLDLIIRFIVEQWVLATALISVLLILVLYESRKAGPALSVIEAIRLVNAEGGIFLDVRESTDYAQGHITDAVHIPISQLEKRVGDLDEYREKPIIVVCRMGQSAGSATKILKSEGFEGANKLSGGMIEWSAQKLPVVTQ